MKSYCVLSRSLRAPDERSAMAIHLTPTELARELVRAYLGATFTGEERHRRRLEKTERLEREPGHASSRTD
jgi:hypothetical protein